MFCAFWPGKALKPKANEGQQQITTLSATGGWLDYMHMRKAPVLEQVLAKVASGNTRSSEGRR